MSTASMLIDTPVVASSDETKAKAKIRSRISNEK